MHGVQPADKKADRLWLCSSFADASLAHQPLLLDNVLVIPDPRTWRGADQDILRVGRNVRMGTLLKDPVRQQL
jgi:hypothetical protein